MDGSTDYGQIDGRIGQAGGVRMRVQALEAGPTAELLLGYRAHGRIWLDSINVLGAADEVAGQQTGSSAYIGNRTRFGQSRKRDQFLDRFEMEKLLA